MRRSDLGTSKPEAGSAGLSEDRTIPVIHEELQVGKHQTVEGEVVLSKKVESETIRVDPALVRGHVIVDRRPCNQVVNSPPAVRIENGETIYSVCEERLVVQTQVVVVEEIRIAIHQEEFHRPQEVTLRKERVDVTQRKD